MELVNDKGLVLVGCGFMGKALLEGWLDSGIRAEAVTVRDPHPSDWLTAQQGIRLNTDLPNEPAAVVVATKPQSLEKVLPGLAGIGAETVFVSIAAGAPVAMFERHLEAGTPVVRVMPNLPASVRSGVSALFANTAASEQDIALVRQLFEAVGTTVVLPEEQMMHLVTGLAGSGPAYVFALTEAMMHAGGDLGLPSDLARALAVETVVGAGRMLAEKHADPTALREAVTSKGGTTAAGLSQLMTGPNGLSILARRTILAAAQRSVELHNELSTMQP